MVDASSIAKYVLREENWINVEKYLLIEEVFSLDLMLKEVLNAIWKHCVLLKTITFETAYSKKNILYRLVKEKIIHIESENEYLDEAFELAIENKITVYDALYIAQALRHQAKLLTSDEKQAKTAQKHNIKTIYVP